MGIPASCVQLVHSENKLVVQQVQLYSSLSQFVVLQSMEDVASVVVAIVAAAMVAIAKVVVEAVVV